jgi:SAM-dependent methyltransferase
MNPLSSISENGPLALENHGERMVPEVSGSSTFWEHVYRYAFACRFVRGKQVLDIACGEGYGAAALQKAGAVRVIGVDISEEACRHARDRYGIETRQGSAESIPLSAGSVDMVVSFETIEHVREPGLFLDECRRVLAPGGGLIISTPNRNAYTGAGGVPNPYHCSEMTEEQFTSVLRSRFRDLRLYTQRPSSAAWWSPRILASDRALPIPGFARLRRRAQSVLFPRAIQEPTNQQRNSVVEQILDASRRRTNPLNPYDLHPRRRWNGEEPIYFVALATRPDEAHPGADAARI